MKHEGALPRPIVSATIDERGNVAIAGESRPRRTGPTGRSNAPCTCSLCGQVGHIISNLRFHPRGG